MRKILGIFLFLFTFLIAGEAQFTVKFSTASVNQNDTANIVVSVDNLTNLFGTQFSINWDSTKFRFGQITNVNMAQGFGENFTFATPEPGNNIKQGTMSFLWSNAQPSSLPNGSHIFTVRLKAVGLPCDSSEILITNNPTVSEYYDENFNVIPLTSVVKGKAKINGSNCSGGTPNDTSTVIVKVGSGVVQPNQEICIPVTVTNFKEIEAVQSKFTWDPAVLQYKEIKNAVQSFSGNDTGVSLGTYNYLWLPPGMLINQTLPNESVFFEVCFTAVGPLGSMTTIALSDDPDETVYSKNGLNHPFQNVDGKVVISNVVPEILKVTIADVTVNKDATVDVSFKVDNFTDIQGFQFAISWDSTVAEYNSMSLVGLNPTLTESVNKGRLNLIWVPSSGVPQTLADGSTLFNVKFKGIGLCQPPSSTTIEIKNQLNFDVLFIGPNTLTVPYELDNGSLTINCGGNPAQCTITAVNNITCNGANNGSINATVAGGDANCQCIWKRDGVQYGNALPISNCNLINLPPGNYTLDVICNGTVSSTCTATIIEPAAIVIGGSVTNVGCGGNGAITLSITNAVNPPTFMWSSGAVTKDISGIPAGTYTVTVTDFNSCTASKSFVVTTVTPGPLAVDVVKADVKCFGQQSGTITLNVTGGCPTFSYAWSDNAGINSGSRTNLPAGTYTVTVTDGSSPANTGTSTIVISQPNEALALTGVPTPSSGSDGTVTITVTGGTGNKTFLWTGPTPFSSTNQNISGLAAGTYSVTVTDANGCTAVNSFVVEVGTGGTSLLVSVSVPSTNLYAGYGVSCVNVCDAIVAGIVGNTGTAPYTVTLSGISTKTLTLAQPGAFQFEDLCTGNYTVKVTDAANKSESKTILVTTPAIIRIERAVKCSDGIQSNGEIDLTISGGAGFYKFNWSHGDDTEDVEDLEIGKYSVVVSDVNGCQQLLQNISINDCTEEGGCYEAIPIITPNNDGVNDYFIINCALEIDNELYIYDRWGKVIYSRKNYDNTWNGVDVDGTDLKENGYMWVFNYTNSDGSKESSKGTVVVLRN